MDHNGSIRIQAQAATALAEWKAFFADQIARLQSICDAAIIITTETRRGTVRL